MTMDIEITGTAQKFFREFPAELVDATAIALDDIGMKGTGFMKSVTPIKTGNLRRSETWSGADNFPYLEPNENNMIADFGNSPLADVKDTVYIGTNVLYAFPMDRMYDYTDMTMQYLEQNVIVPSFETQIQRKLDKP